MGQIALSLSCQLTNKNGSFLCILCWGGAWMFLFENSDSNLLSQEHSGGLQKGRKCLGNRRSPFSRHRFSLCACEVDIGISCLGFSCGVHLVGRVGNSCLHHTKVSLLGLTVSVSVQRKESILLDYGCALSVKQQTCSV